jgi:hypothetical protein
VKTAGKLVEGYNTYLGTAGLDNVGKIHKMFRGGMESRRQHIEIVALKSGFQNWADDCEKYYPWKYVLPGFSLLGTHPAMCGLILLDIRDEHHRTAINMAGSQGQVLVAAHLYNAAKSSGLLASNVQWADMDYFIEKQGSDWIFVGKRPEDPSSIFRRLNIAKGLGVSKFAKDYKDPKSGNGKDGRYTIVGKIRNFEYLARYSELSYERVSPQFKKPSGLASKAGLDITVMADTMAREVLGIEESVDLSSLATLRAFKKAVDKDGEAFNFDVMDLYLRCVRLLGDIQAHYIKNAPHDFPKSEYAHGLGMNDVINEMLRHCVTLVVQNKLMLPDAVNILRKVIEQEGGTTLANAMARAEYIKLQQTKPQTEVEPSFENPHEDWMDLEFRNRFSTIMFGDEHGNVRMPFGPR